MSNVIRVLDTNVVDQIAAGEVVEKPASVIKELIENSLDAGARNVSVLIENGGLDYISVEDDGIGMSKQDLSMSVERFATSKLNVSDDLERISTYGFRGEALPSIASVSRFSIRSKEKDSNIGCLLEVLDNGAKQIVEISCDFGTKIEVRDLFYNVPARRKFLKSEKTESNSIKNIVSDFAIARPDVSFLLQEGNSELLSFNSLNSLSDRISKLNLIQGKQVVVNYKRDFVAEENKNEINALIKISGIISEPLFCPKIGSKIRFLVNKRIIKSPFILRAVREGYQNLLKPGYFPSGVISIEITPSQVDVNVHPQKTEVRFANEGLIFSSVRNAVSSSLLNASSEVLYGEGNLNEQSNVYETKKVYELKSFNRAFDQQQEIRFIGNSSFVETVASNEVSNLLEKVISPVPNKIESAGTRLNAQNFKFLGQAFKLYLFFASLGKVAVVDMHAAHERVTFFKLKNEFLNKNINMQELLFPFAMPIGFLSTKEGLEEKLVAIKLLGIDAELRNEDIVVRAISPLLDSEKIKELLVELIDKSPVEGLDLEINSRLDSYLARIACHNSLRRGRELKPEEAYELMQQLENAELSGWCPHGRPVIWWLSHNDLEKQFGRIQ